MDIEQFTHASQELINQAAKDAQQRQNPTLQPVHLLWAALHNEFCTAMLQALSVPKEQLISLTQQALDQLPTASGTQLGMDYALQAFLDLCKQEANKLKDSFISLEHIMLALAQTEYLPKAIATFLKQHTFTPAQILAYMKELRKGSTVDTKSAESQYQILDRYAQNITEQARLGKLDPVIGRHDEIRRVIQILSRRTKNNPVLIGEPGVGKTAIVEGIAQRIINNDVPESLKGKKVYGLDLGLLIAGAKYQGEFEDRIKGILKEIEKHPDDIILFIDEMHMLIGAGSTGGGMDASNLLKPALARGQLHCIGATTLKEYKKYIETDAALERRFQKVFVEEPSVDDAISILRGLKERYELHHGIHIKDQALVSAVKLAAKNIPDRFLPDKAIDLVDEAAAMVKMSIDSHPEQIDRLERSIRQLEIEKVALQKEKDDAKAQERLAVLQKELAELKSEHDKFLSQWKAEKAPLEKINKIKEEIERANYQYQLAEREGNFAKASEIKYGKIVQLEKDLEQEQQKVKALKTNLIKQEVDEDDVAAVLARWTKIPAAKLKESESEKILHMAQTLQEQVIGQHEAIDKVVSAIQMHRAGLTDPGKPIGSFLFLGPTGVGKTEVARTLAEFLFNDANKMIRIDMSEYMEKHAVARLIGAPPGYVGYEEGGQLTEQVRRHPYCVILFDEIEKAHSDVFNIFLQILDEGRLTDSQGRTVSFKNSIIIMTSNIGSSIILDAKELNDDIKEQVNKLLYHTFRPEFLNRIDAIVYFKKLTPSDVKQIAQLQINELAQRLAERSVQLDISQEAIAHIAELGYSPDLGARPLKRAITNHITVPISQFLLKTPDAKIVHVEMKKGQLTIQ